MLEKMMKNSIKKKIIFYIIILFLILLTIFLVYPIVFLELKVGLITELVFIGFIISKKMFRTLEFWTILLYLISPLVSILTRYNIFEISWSLNLEIFQNSNDEPLLGVLIGTILIYFGLILLAFIWKENKFSEDELMELRPYFKIRHPNQTIFFLIIIGLLIQWPSIIRLILFPFLAFLLYQHAKKIDEEMIKKFPKEYQKYMFKTNMFIPIKITRFLIVRKIRKNAFLLLSILLFCFLIIGGSILVTNSYKNDYQKFEGELNPIMKIPISLKISCDIETEIPISGDLFWCEIISSETKHENSIYKFNESFFENNSYEDYSINLSYSTGSIQNYMYDVYDSNSYNLKSLKKINLIENLKVHSFESYSFAIPIENPGNNFIQFHITFLNEKTGEILEIGPPLFNFYRYKSISQEEKNKKQYEKIAIYLGLISLSLTISFTSIRNFMEIWDRK